MPTTGLRASLELLHNGRANTARERFNIEVDTASNTCLENTVVARNDPVRRIGREAPLRSFFDFQPRFLVRVRISRRQKGFQIEMGCNNESRTVVWRAACDRLRGHGEACGTR